MVDINIALDPVNDGIVQKTEKITCISKGALVIATNGKSRFVNLDRVPYELEGLADISYSEFLGDTEFLLIFNANKIFNVGTGRFFVGSVLVMKNDDGALVPMTREDCEIAGKEFQNRLATLVCDGHEFSAYELI